VELDEAGGTGEGCIRGAPFSLNREWSVAGDQWIEVIPRASVGGKRRGKGNSKFGGHLRGGGHNNCTNGGSISWGGFPNAIR